jgi:hypothetical protein
MSKLHVFKGAVLMSALCMQNSEERAFSGTSIALRALPHDATEAGYQHEPHRLVYLSIHPSTMEQGQCSLKHGANRNEKR